MEDYESFDDWFADFEGECRKLGIYDELDKYMFEMAYEEGRTPRATAIEYNDGSG